MIKLSDLTKSENCFTTIDGKILKNVFDLKNYLITCSENNYSHHVSSSKNDFASWVKEVLASKELSERLTNSITLAKAIDTINLFLNEFDYKSEKISEDKTFHTKELFSIKNIQELYYYINNCNDSDFIYYVNNQKNDFANWVNDILLFSDLALKIRKILNRSDTALLLKRFLLNDGAFIDSSEYMRYINERLTKDIKDIKEDIDVVKNVNNEKKKSTLESSADSVMTSVINSSGKIEETIDLTKRPNLEVKEEPDKITAPEFDMSGFKQYTDEELDKFISFSKKEVTLTPSVKVEYLKNALQELNNIILDLRRIEKDPLVADLMLRTVSAKIDYYAISNNLDDYNHIIRLFKDVQHEIEECATQQSYNLAEEILNNLKFQAIALKKA